MKQEQKQEQQKYFNVKVYRANVDPENKDLEISVNAVGATNGKKIFAPGEVVQLTATQIDILKNAVEEHEIPVSEDSGVYASNNPLKSAEKQFPGFSPRMDKITGRIYMIKRTPNYIIEQVM